MNYNSVHSKVLRPLSHLFRDDLDVYSDCVEHFIFLQIEMYVYVFYEINRIMYIFHDPAKKTPKTTPSQLNMSSIKYFRRYSTSMKLSITRAYER